MWLSFLRKIWNGRFGSLLLLALAGVLNGTLRATFVFFLISLYNEASQDPSCISTSLLSLCWPFLDFEIRLILALFVAFLIAIMGFLQGEIQIRHLSRILRSQMSLRLKESEGMSPNSQATHAVEPLRLFLAAKTISQMIPVVTQSLILTVGIFLVDIRLGAFLLFMLPVSLYIGAALAKLNSRSTKRLSSSLSGNDSDDDDESGGGLSNIRRELLRNLSGDSRSSRDLARKILAGESPELNTWIDLRRSWLLSGPRANGLAFASLGFLITLPAAFQHWGLGSIELSEIAAVAGLGVMLTQSLTQISGALAVLGRFHSLVQGFVR